MARRSRPLHDHIASTVFDLVSLAGITGTMEPRGIFSMAVPAEVLAAALAEDGSRRSRPGAVPDYCFTVDGRRMLYDVKRISFCPSRYWPTVAVASSRGGPLEHRASLVRAEYEAAAAALDARTAAWYIRTGTAAPVGAPTAVDILASFPPVRGLVFGSTACGGCLRQHRLRGVQGGQHPPSSLLRLRRRQPSVSGAARSALAPCSTRDPS